MVSAVAENTAATGLMLPDGGNGAMSVYGRIKDPMEFINAMGKVFAFAGACGVKNENEGKVLALACMCKGKDPFELQEDYHIIDGKLSMRADTMLAKFRERGGKHVWVKDGTDGVAAELRLTDKDGNTVVSKFDIEKAKAAGYVKPNGQWAKRPDQMLRSRCITDGVRMIAPEVNSGRYTPEELDDSQIGGGSVVVTPIRTAEEVAARRKELQAEAAAASAEASAVAGGTAVKEVSNSVAATHIAAGSTIIDVEPEKPPFVVDETVTQEERIAAEIKTLKLAEIESIANQFGQTAATIITGINGRDKTNYATLDDLPDDKADALLARLRQKLNERDGRQPGSEG